MIQVGADCYMEKPDRENKLLKKIKAEGIEHLGTWVWDIKDYSEWWSDEQFRIFGYKPGQ